MCNENLISTVKLNPKDMHFTLKCAVSMFTLIDEEQNLQIIRILFYLFKFYENLLLLNVQR